jgi:prevent-host-death family protein
MEKKVAAFEARRHFGTLIEDVSAKGDKVIVERHGKPVAVVVPLEVYEQWKAERIRFFDMIELAANNADLSPDEADRLAEEAVAAVRASR